MKPKYTFVIPTWNGLEMLKDCLASIERQTVSNYEIIVVENGSTDGSKKWLAERGNLGVIDLDSNLGFAKAVNLGIERAGGEFIILLNNDIVLETNWLEKIEQATLDNPSGVFFATIMRRPGNDNVVCSAGFELLVTGGVYEYTGTSVADLQNQGTYLPRFGAVAAAAIYRANDLKKVACLEEVYFAYGEDTDLSVKLRGIGLNCVLVTNATSLHLGSATGRKIKGFKTYLTRRNVDILFFLNFYSLSFFLCVLPHLAYESLAILAAVLRRDSKYVIKAKWDFLKMLPQIWRLRRQRRIMYPTGSPLKIKMLSFSLFQKWKTFLS